MIRLSLIIVVISVITACSSTKITSEKKRISECSEHFKNDFSRLQLAETLLTINNKTEKVTEAKFICVYSFLQTKKVMYDSFGLWNSESSSKKQHHPLLIWNDIPLLENVTEKFTIIASGKEHFKIETYASISVLDENGRDALSSQSRYKTALIDYFSNMIKETNHENDTFYNVYLKKVSPKKWEKIYKTKP
ncbi:hypothetical protein [Aequorivita marina]|uniref:hypothetical protein n=1 Tax=Aequorivita marina TaxID=3073654 RepID=UPI002876EA0E|nr:hypothetical protein [Aequorivita sp. S2608]MDS1299757.1 hypothetical protein [Aequorivita sp. S2608]